MNKSKWRTGELSETISDLISTIESGTTVYYQLIDGQYHYMSFTKLVKSDKFVIKE
jgi:hypothetical protein